MDSLPLLIYEDKLLFKEDILDNYDPEEIKDIFNNMSVEDKKLLAITRVDMTNNYKPLLCMCGHGNFTQEEMVMAMRNYKLSNHLDDLDHSSIETFARNRFEAEILTVDIMLKRIIKQKSHKDY